MTMKQPVSGIVGEKLQLNSTVHLWFDQHCIFDRSVSISSSIDYAKRMPVQMHRVPHPHHHSSRHADTNSFARLNPKRPMRTARACNCPRVGTTALAKREVDDSVRPVGQQWEVQMRASCRLDCWWSCLTLICNVRQ